MADADVVYVGDGDCEYVWLENDPGYETYNGFRHVSSCKKCEAQHVPMYGFDSARGEYEGLYICVECMMEIVGEVDRILGRDDK